jgi:hypothetical protein
MKKLNFLFLALCLTLSNLLNAQNPFESIGKKSKPMLTLSKGKYIEYFNNDSVRQIGSAMVNVYTEQIVAFVDRKEQVKKIHAQTSSRFLSVDPLVSQFTWNSPYAYCENRPIDGIDLDGKEWSSSGKVFNFFTGKTEINYEIRIKVTDANGVESKTTSQLVKDATPQVESILGNEFAKGTIDDPIITVKLIEDKNAGISVGLAPKVVADGKIVNGYTTSKSNSQIADIKVSTNSDAPGGLGSTLAHELGHDVGLSHPWEVTNTTDPTINPELDIKQPRQPIPPSVGNEIKNNLMNSGGNPAKELKGRTNQDRLTPGQRAKIEQTVQSEQPKK